ncbi:DUF87 domain-containing protein [Candidatus Kaiserbacteria bacterium]|nr:DUF87 domain-containing protein [Candidatus Kaiserbacteria bacterium]
MEQFHTETFSSPEEEIAYLRARIAEREQELGTENSEVSPEAAGTEVLRQYQAVPAETVLPPEQAMQEAEVVASVEQLSGSQNKIEEVLSLARERGIKNSLSVLEKLDDAFITDEVHRKLVEDIRTAHTIADLKEGAPLWRVLDMTLFEIALPEHGTDDAEADLHTLLSAMDQFYAGMQTISQGKENLYYTIEIAVSDKRDDIIFYVAVPTAFIALFEKQILSLFPRAMLTVQQNDYNIFVDGGESGVAVGALDKHFIFPLHTYESFKNDPINVILNAFSRIEKEGGGAAVQLIVGGDARKHKSTVVSIINRLEKGDKKDIAIRKSTIGGELFESARDLFMGSKKSKEGESAPTLEIDTDTIERCKEKMATPILSTNIRLVVSATNASRVGQILTELESGFHQFENTQGNQFKFKRLSGSQKRQELKAFSFREMLKSRVLPLSIAELSTILHFPAAGLESSPQFKQSHAKVAPAPLSLPTEGTLLGENHFQNKVTPVRLSAEDRLRHFYVIGQTGTGKTTLLKNMIVQDIKEGAGVCFIDPHGSDIQDVLAAVPRERWDDVIYFDPARTDMVMGLNMLEYDSAFPEQKTFVVNELFSIFQKLYGGNPESMGPIFEQYFRNSTQLVLEDPDSGNTLLDVSRVMADAEYRALKLERARNPVVVQFWRDIATKAGGEAALENIVPYITSKFDVFTANDYMRPIIGQQQSSFQLRSVMDTKKILLVNLSKGRLGEINANLIGMILVGKILMAALSRVDDPSRGFPPFYLYMDEFQNVTTDSIAAILSEARKYKLGLTIAHQFIAQIDERIRDAVFGNVGSLAVFRVGPEDAQFLEQQFEPIFSASNLMNIENRNACVRILSDGTPTQPFSIRTLAPEPADPAATAEIIDHAYQRYARPRAEVEEKIIARYQ